MPGMGLKELQCLQLGGGEEKDVTEEVAQGPHTKSASIFPK